LVLAFSSKSIEERIEYVTAQSLTASHVVWLPLGLALVVTIAFYLLSVGFLALYESYSVLRSFVERKFDKVRWVSPATYIAFKEQKLSSDRRLIALATDNLEELNAQIEKTTSSEAKRLETQDELAATRIQLQQRTEEVSALSRDSSVEKQRINELVRKVSEFQAERIVLESTVRNLASEVSAADYPSEGGIAQLTRPDPRAKQEALRSLLSAQSKLRVVIPSQLLDDRVSEDSLEKYVRVKYPLLDVGPSVLRQAFADIGRAELLGRVSSIRQLDEIVDKVGPAILRYSIDEPTLFRYGADFITKSLGFAFPLFRSIHPFSERTRAAFDRYKI
jgi:hypothetical protein